MGCAKRTSGSSAAKGDDIQRPYASPILPPQPVSVLGLGRHARGAGARLVDRAQDRRDAARTIHAGAAVFLGARARSVVPLGLRMVPLHRPARYVRERAADQFLSAPP